MPLAPISVSARGDFAARDTVGPSTPSTQGTASPLSPAMGSAGSNRLSRIASPELRAIAASSGLRPPGSPLIRMTSLRSRNSVRLSRRGPYGLSTMQRGEVAAEPDDESEQEWDAEDAEDFLAELGSGGGGSTNGAAETQSSAGSAGGSECHAHLQPGSQQQLMMQNAADFSGLRTGSTATTTTHTDSVVMINSANGSAASSGSGGGNSYSSVSLGAARSHGSSSGAALGPSPASSSSFVLASAGEPPCCTGGSAGTTNGPLTGILGSHGGGVVYANAAGTIISESASGPLRSNSSGSSHNSNTSSRHTPMVPVHVPGLGNQHKGNLMLASGGSDVMLLGTTPLGGVPASMHGAPSPAGYGGGASAPPSRPASAPSSAMTSAEGGGPVSLGGLVGPRTSGSGRGNSSHSGGGATGSPSPDEKRDWMVMLQRVFDASGLNKAQLDCFIARLRTAHFASGQPIVRQGEEGDRFFIIEAGEVTVEEQRGADDEPRVLTRLYPGNHFGEYCLIREQKRVASIVARSPGGVTCRYLEKASFQDLMEADRAYGTVVEGLIKETEATRQKREAAQRKGEPNVSKVSFVNANANVAKITKTARRGVNEQRQETINTYTLLRQLGAGSYGRVHLCTDSSEQQLGGKGAVDASSSSTAGKRPIKYYAIKVVDKQKLRKRRLGASDAELLREVEVMKKLRHPNLVALHEVGTQLASSVMLVYYENEAMRGDLTPLHTLCPVTSRIPSVISSS